MEQGVLLVEDYNGEWKKSLFVSEDGTYSLMKEDPRGENDLYFSGMPNDVTEVPVVLDRDMLWLANWTQSKHLWIQGRVEIELEGLKTNKNTKIRKEAKKPLKDIILDGFLITGFELESLEYHYATYVVDIAPVKKPPIHFFSRKTEEMARVPVENWNEKFVKERWKNWKFLQLKGQLGE